MGIFETGTVAGKFNHGHLEPKADAQKRDPALACKTNRLDLGLDTTIAKAAWNDDGIQIKFRKDNGYYQTVEPEQIMFNVVGTKFLKKFRSLEQISQSVPLSQLV